MTNDEIIKAVAAAVAKAMAPTTKVVNGPLPRDAGNAPSPDNALPEGLNGGMPQLELAAWRAPAELRGMAIGTAGGMMQIPPHGIVHTKANDDHEDVCDCAGCAVNKELRNRGFRRQQSVKRASEIIGDEIRAVLASGAAKGRAMDAARNLDKTGALAAEVGGDVMRWLSKRNEANFPQPEVTRWTPKEVYIEKLMVKGYSRLEAEKIANGDAI
jgi:hypothetical protein